MLIEPISDNPPVPAKHRRFRIFVGMLCVVGIVLLILQYTPYHVLPERKTSTLWGFLVGVLAMTAYAEYRWSAARRD
jgi:hypothetical protein